MGAALREYGGSRVHRDFGPRDFGPPNPRDFGFSDYPSEPRMRSFSPPPGPRGPPPGFYRGQPPPGPPRPRDPSPQWLPRYGGSPGREPSPPRRYGPPRDLSPPRGRYGPPPFRDPSPPRRRYSPPEAYRGPMSARYRDRDGSPPRRQQYRSDPYDSDEDRRRFDEETRQQFRYSRSPERRRPVANYSGGWY